MKRWVTLLILFACAGPSACKKKRPPKPEQSEPAAATKSNADDEGTAVQARVGGDPGAVSHRLDFTIAAVYEGHKPTDAPPWHEAGGEWTFFDAEAGGGGFTAGFMTKPAEGMPFEFGDGFIVAQTPESGGAFVAALAKGLGQSVPATNAADATTLRPIKSAPVVLGRNVGRSPDGSFAGEGDWIAAKYTFETTEETSEVFVNINLSAKKGEFAEKDSMYNEGLIKALAQGLRDGNYPAL